MTYDWPRIIKRISPVANPAIVGGLADAMPRLTSDYALTNELRLAHFLAQVAHESDGFKTTTEYASGAAYEGRKDLGNTQPGDGRRFRGRGLIQVTGRANAAAVSKALGQDFIANPTLLAAFPWAALTAGWFWSSRNLNALADRDDVKGITRKINGGYNGLQDRMARLAKAKAALAECKASAISPPAPVPQPVAPAAPVAATPVAPAPAAAPEPPQGFWGRFAASLKQRLGG